MHRRPAPVLILGGGLAGLAAGYALARAGRRVQVLEGGRQVGGLARTWVCNGFRFDLGGHRFFTHDTRVERFVRELLGPELLSVPRASRIRLRGRWIDYPLRPWGALVGLGARTSAAILLGYLRARLAQRLHPAPLVSLEDWVVAHFGRPLFELYFRDYSEKVWGIGCRDVSAQWMAERVQGLSLGTAVRRALWQRGPALPTLVDRFLYPRLGIGRIAERLHDEIGRSGEEVLTNTRIEYVRHDSRRILGIAARRGEGMLEFSGTEFLSTIPLTRLVQALQPHAPAEVRATAARMRYRDLVIVAVMLSRERATDQTWIYFPEKDIPFGRLHEPTNWSAAMAPPGCTLLVTERFCFRGDATWNAADAELIETTVAHLERLGFVRRADMCDGAVVRIPAAYPLFEVGCQARTRVLCDYLARFENLQLAGRGGMFRYYNMDHAMASGLAAAEAILRRDAAPLAAAAGNAS
ncbi:MAG: FAD-dependent oxidoreductase [Gammaproteobacteria bacterium]|nr:FAD-dependent oxidoreductase [Gammaproteobacteria bacterium]